MADLFTNHSDGTIRVPITNKKHQALVHRFIGAADVYTDLDSKKDLFGKMPGWNAAMAMVEKSVAELKCGMMGAHVSAALKAGVDLTAYRVHSIDGRHVICIPVDYAAEEADSDGDPT